MKIYIAGPMTGYPGLNFDAFNSAAADIRAEGHEAVNPAEINPDLEADWLDCMIEDLKQLKTCDAILMLPGWEESDGANIEYIAARRLKLKEATFNHDELGT